MRYEIESLAKGGEGIARVDGKTYFIAKTLPGECGEFKVTDEKKNFGRGVVVKCDKVSHFRCKDHCPVKACNGCGFRHVVQSKSLELKAKAVHENVIRQAHVSNEIPVKYWPVTEFDGTRRRVRIHVMRSGSGLFVPGTHKVVDISKCLVLAPALREVVADVAKNFVWKCDPVLDVQIDLDDQDRAFAEVTVAELEENTRNNDKQGSKFNKNRGSRKPFMGRYEKESVANYLSSAVERGVLAGGAFENLVWGQRALRDIVRANGAEVVTWRRIGRFGQATREANEILHKLVSDVITEVAPKTVYDLFCGAGNFTFRAAMQAKDVTGVEFFGDRDTFLQGREETAQKAQLGNVTLRLYDLDKGLPEDMKHADLVITDPARVGMTDELCRQLISLGPEYILYISCEASCLGRDLAHLLKGYYPLVFHYVDMFPNTPELETVCVLRKKPVIAE